MASPCAIDGVMRAIDRYRPRRILEVGAGIGTITAAILEAAPAETEIVTAENNDYCREQLAENLGAALDRVTLIRSTDEVTGTFEFVVVDGEQISDVVKFVSDHGVVLVEGDREPQRDQLIESGRPFCVQHVRTLSLMAPDDPWSHASVERYHGGYYLFRFEPTANDRRRFAVADYWHVHTIGWRRRVRRVVGLERPRH